MQPHLRHLTPAALLVLALLTLLPGCSMAQPAQYLDTIRLPDGFAIGVYARVPGARAMAVLPGSRAVVVGSRNGAVHAVLDADGDHRGDRVVQLADGLKTPHGVAWHDGWLYVSERDRIWRVRAASADALAQPLDMDAVQVVHEGMPDESHHGTRDIAFGPDGKLYVALGSPCNVCMPETPADHILRMNPDGSAVETFARGLRNSVGLAFQPGTGELYFTDNGADWMGNTTPPDELNRAPQPGLHFGFPYYGGGHARTEDFADREPPQDVTFPVVEFGAHGAALGLHFYTGAMFPAAYRGDAFVAQHGSWNRSPPFGYRVLRVRFRPDGTAAGTEVFAEGWLQGVTAWGRPVDVAALDDGSLLVSDDSTGTLYRITYGR